MPGLPNMKQRCRRPVPDQDKDASKSVAYFNSGAGFVRHNYCSVFAKMLIQDSFLADA